MRFARNDKKLVRRGKSPCLPRMSLVVGHSRLLTIPEKTASCETLDR